MTRRFDEIELYPDSFPAEMIVHSSPAPLADVPAQGIPSAPVWKRALTFLTDLALFAALGLALTPLMPVMTTANWMAWAAFAGFVLLISFFYFVGSWLVWGKTVGGALFDVRIVGDDGEPATFASSTRRWGAMFASIGTAGIGCALALLPSRRSLADRISKTIAIVG